MRLRLSLILSLFLLILPETARADMVSPYTFEIVIGLGGYFYGVIGIILFSLSIILLEAFVLVIFVKKWLKKSILYTRAILISLLANIVSTVLGTFLMFDFRSLLILVWPMLIVFSFTVLIEFLIYWMMMKKDGFDKRGLISASFLANIVSYILIISLVLAITGGEILDPYRGPSLDIAEARNICLTTQANPSCEFAGQFPPTWDVATLRVGSETLSCKEVMDRMGKPSCSCENKTLSGC